MWYYLTLPTLATSECSSSHHVLVDADDRLNKSPVLEGEIMIVKITTPSHNQVLYLLLDYQRFKITDVFL